MTNWKHTVLTWTRRTLWLATGICLVVLLVAAMRQEDSARCAGVDIKIYGVSTHYFVDQADILDAVRNFCDGEPEGQRLTSFNLRDLESSLRKNVWVKSVEAYFDKFHRLRISLHEREPVARVFAIDGETFYVDSSLTRLPLSNKYAARLPIFTAFPVTNFQWTKYDSLLVNDLVILSQAIQADAFSMALIDQIDIQPDREFVFIPKIGEAPIRFGKAVDVEQKLRRLRLFYQEILPKAGWSKYAEISVANRGQVVARIAGLEDKRADSLRTMEILAQLAEQAAARSADSLSQIRMDDSSNTVSPAMIDRSVEREEPIGSPLPGTPVSIPSEPVVKPAVKPVPPTNNATVGTLPARTATPPAAKPVKKPNAKPTAPPAARPKPATTQRPTTNDY